VLAFSKFPLDKHDDDVDAFTQVVNWKRSRIDYSMFNQPVNIYQGIRA
jgi:phage terminase large subunit-like protein